jgi:hypothetical protein
LSDTGQNSVNSDTCPRPTAGVYRWGLPGAPPPAVSVFDRL